ncbi:putative 2-methylcitrate dehydratase, partial [Aureobasidium melanogenum]
MPNPANPYLGSESPEYLGGECGGSLLIAVAAATAVSTPHNRVGRGALRAKTSAPHLGRGSSQPAPANRHPSSPAAPANGSSSVRGRSDVKPILGRGGLSLGGVPVSPPDAFGLAQYFVPQTSAAIHGSLDNTTTITLLALPLSLATCISSFTNKHFGGLWAVMSSPLGRTLLRTCSRNIVGQRSLLRNTARIASRASIAPTSFSIRSAAAFSTTMKPNSDAVASPAPAAEFDREITDMASYIHNYKVTSELAIDTARYVFLDTLGCGLKALEFPHCTKLLGPVVPGTTVPNGTKIPGTPYQLDPVLGAFNIGAMIRWLDFNDCWLAAEWGHPSDNLGAILSVADWISRTNRNGGNLGNGKIFTVRDVLEAMVKAHEIQGCMALENSFNKVGLDHVVLVKVASTAVVSQMLGLTEAQTRDAISQAWVDGQSMRTYRHSPNTMSRKSWAAGDACEKAVNLCLKVMKGEGGMATVLTAPTWGFYDVNFHGAKFNFQREYGSYVMENVLFKVSYPAEFHSQTAVEAASRLNKKLRAMGKTAEDIKDVTNRTHEACIRIIDKQLKPMDNFADRDHCVQYMVATMFVFNRLEASDYTDGSEAATSPLVESLRKRIKCVEDPQYTKDYHDPEKRTISNALTVTLNDGTTLEEEIVEAPLGHRLRRDEAKPEIMAKYKRHLGPHFDEARVNELIELGNSPDKLYAMEIDQYVDLYVKESK